MSRPLRILLPALSAGAVAHLVLAWKNSQGHAAAHRWSEQGLGWLSAEDFAHQPTGRGALIALGVMAILAVLVEREAGEASPLRKVVRLIGHPLVVLIATAAAIFAPRLAASSSRPTPPSGAPNVLFIMVDTWRADHAGFLGYERNTTPKLDALVPSGVVFEEAISQASWTKPAVGTLFTGQVPSQHGAVSNPIQGQAVRGVSLTKSRTTFLEVLRANGWETAAWSANPNVIPARGFGQGAGVFFDAFNDPRRGPDFDPGRAENQIASLERWLREEADSQRPFAVYLHLMDPHYPYRAPAPFGGTFDEGTIEFDLDGRVCDAFYEGEKDIGTVTPAMVQHVIDVYDEEILYMDHHVGNLIERVLLEHPNTVIVLVSDHGEEFLEHGQFGHGIGLWNTLVHVPLVFWAPNLEPARITSQVRLMDVPSTLFELVGLASKTPASFQGTSLMPVVLGAESQHRLAPMENGGDGRPAWQWRGISDGRTKALVREPDLDQRPAPPLTDWERDLPAPVRFLFDLENDPGETAAPLSTASDSFDTLMESMRRAGWYTSPTDLFSGLRAQRVNLGDNVEELRNLGYADDGDVEALGETP